jgi:hypothetical protein
MEEYIAADPITMDHHDLFQELQRLSLDWRLQDPFASLVNILLVSHWLVSDQIPVKKNNVEVVTRLEITRSFCFLGKYYSCVAKPIIIN